MSSLLDIISNLSFFSNNPIDLYCSITAIYLTSSLLSPILPPPYPACSYTHQISTSPPYPSPSPLLLHIQRPPQPALPLTKSLHRLPIPLSPLLLHIQRPLYPNLKLTKSLNHLPIPLSPLLLHIQLPPHTPLYLPT